MTITDELRHVLATSLQEIEKLELKVQELTKELTDLQLQDKGWIVEQSCIQNHEYHQVEIQTRKRIAIYDDRG